MYQNVSCQNIQEHKITGHQVPKSKNDKRWSIEEHQVCAEHFKVEIHKTKKPCKRVLEKVPCQKVSKMTPCTMSLQPKSVRLCSLKVSNTYYM